MAQKNDKILSLLGIAKKAGRLAGGEFMTERSVKEGKAYLVIVAGDASNNTKKNFHDMCDYYHVPIMEYADKETLGNAIGCEIRASLAINDQGFAQSISKHYESFRNTEVVIDE